MASGWSRGGRPGAGRRADPARAAGGGWSPPPSTSGKLATPLGRRCCWTRSSHYPPIRPCLQAHIAHVRGHIELACGTPGSACTLLVQGARQILGSNADLATEMLVLATWAALATNQLDRIVEEIGPANSRLTGQDDVRV